MNIKSFKTKFKIFGILENPVHFGDSCDAHLISARAPGIKAKRVELYEGNADSSCVTAKQLFDYIKSLKECDEFDLFFVPTGGGEWCVDRVSPYPKNGVVYLDCDIEMSG